MTRYRRMAPCPPYCDDTETRPYRGMTGGLSDKDKEQVRQAGLGAGLFTGIVVAGGLIYLMTKIGEK
jgi:hypothetical protein